jgi:hypothetical protein
VRRYCRGDDNGEVLVPIWHMWEQRYSATFLARVEEANARYPWQQKEKQLFSVTGGYHRHVSHRGANQKHGHDGSELLYVRAELAWVARAWRGMHSWLAAAGFWTVRVAACLLRPAQRLAASW